jgi:type I restriction enzyme M protein
VKTDRLDAVIGLPPNLFYSTSIPACLLIFQAARPERYRGHLLFVDASKRFRKGKNQNSMADEDIRAVLSAYRSADTTSDESAVPTSLISHAEIEGNGWDLNIGRYLKATAIETVDVATALVSLREAQGRLHNAEAELDEHLREAGYA